MKIKQKNLKDIVAELYENLNKAHKRNLREAVQYEANTYASKNLPAVHDGSIEPYLTTIKGRYIGLKTEVCTRLKGSLKQLRNSVSVPTLSQEITLLTETIQSETRRIEEMEKDKDRIGLSGSYTAYALKRWLLFLFALAESLLNVSVFLHLGDILIIAVPVGFIVGLAQVYTAEAAMLNIKEVHNRAWRRIYFVTAFVGFFIFSFVLGLIRYHYAHIGHASDVPFVFLNPGTFAAFNMMFVIASGLLVYFYFPSRAEIKELETVAHLEKEIKKATKWVEKLDAERKQALADREDLVVVNAEIEHDQRELLAYVDAHYDTAIGVFKTENVSKRPDKLYPPCFLIPHEPLGGPVNVEYSFIDFKA